MASDMSGSHVDCVVIGAGVVGLAMAREMARRGREVIILEVQHAFGLGISSRNSEVIHAGLYYATDSLKAKLCVRGRELLYGYCEKHHIAVNRCGKLVVATEERQVAALDQIAAQAKINGVHDISRMTGEDAARLEPEIRCHAALYSPSTGVLDSHSFMLSLLGEAETAGAMIAYDVEVERLIPAPDGLAVQMTGDDKTSLLATTVINAAGLGALPVLNRSGLGIELPRQVLAKGNYFRLDARSPVKRLIYPVPETGGLGVHITLDLAGRARFGPDVEWVDELDYNVDETRADVFYAAIRTYWPGLPDHALVSDYAGIRPKIADKLHLYADFRIQGPEVHGVAGLVNLLGIESPGLTSALGIAEYAANLLQA